MLKFAAEVYFYYVQNNVKKINKEKLFFGRPTKIGKSYGKRESKASLGRKFQRFCGIFNGIRAMAILLILFCM